MGVCITKPISGFKLVRVIQNKRDIELERREVKKEEKRRKEKKREKRGEEKEEP